MCSAFTENYEIIVDIGNIGPDYIPGHAHSDTFSFELYINSEPFIVDTGTSTYETGKRRQLERSTSSHNTVEIDHKDQSEVWGGFRVARRAYIKYLKESDNTIEAVHDGYKSRLGVLHKRGFVFEEGRILIKDEIFGKRSENVPAIARLHFHPNVDLSVKNDKIVTKSAQIYIKQKKFFIKPYKYAPEFNKTIDAKMVEIPFTKNLEIEIRL